MPSRDEQISHYLHQAESLRTLAEDMRSNDPNAADDLCEMARHLTRKAAMLTMAANWDTESIQLRHSESEER